MEKRPRAPWATIVGAQAGVFSLSMVAIRSLISEIYMSRVTLAWAIASALSFGFTAYAYTKEKRARGARDRLVQCPGCMERIPPWFIDPERNDVWQVNQIPHPNPPRIPWRVERQGPLSDGSDGGGVSGTMRRGQVFQVLACRVCRNKSTHYPGWGQSQRSFTHWETKRFHA